MSSTNINDPAGVQSLLAQLRASQAWQAIDPLATPGPSSAHPTTQLTPVEPPEASPENTTSNTAASVASLLSQLQASSALTRAPPHPSPTAAPLLRAPPPTRSTVSERESYDSHTKSQPVSSGSTSSAVRQDRRAFTFQQSLPHLAQLSEDPGIISALSEMRNQQNELERRLMDERSSIQRKHEEKVKVAQAKAKILGSGLSQHEATMLSDAYRHELAKFDKERVLVAWDGLTAKQQAALEKMGVPTMFVTDVKTHREVNEITQIYGSHN
ncbi:hypothetical protein HWV62_36057 [Athelia sp. TMB]|nr:hypothetical protein HWV62_36057 [Athelia sp. TMB]